MIEQAKEFASTARRFLAGQQ